MAIYRVQFFRFKAESSQAQPTVTLIKENKITLTDQPPLESLFTLDFSKSEKSTATISLGADTSCDLTFNTLRYHKRVYQPGCVEIRLKADNLKKSDLFSTRWEQALANYFRGLVVDVWDVQHKPVTIAAKYYIFQIVPRVVKSDKKTSINLQLTAYSPDKFLTMDQFSNAFTGKRLFGEMIPNMLTRYVQKGTFRKFIQLSQTIEANLNFLTAESTEKQLKAIINTITDPALKKTFQTILKGFQSQFKGEYILPYSVQYNESFYDFLVRMLNRYGEYLFMEEGVLHVGLPDKANQCTTISQYKSYALVDNALQTLDNISVTHPNAMQDPYAVNSSNQEMLYNSEISTEELCTPIGKLEEVTMIQLLKLTQPGLRLTGEAAIKATPILIRKAYEYLDAPSLIKLITFLAITYGLETWHHISKTKTERSNFNKTYFTTDKQANESEEDFQKRMQQYDSKQNQFAPYSNLVGMSKELFRRIELAEQQMSRTQMQVECDGDFQSILLGDFFQLDTDTQTYITTEIIGEAKWENEAYTSSLTVNGVPVQTSTGEDPSKPQRIYWPIPADQARIRQSGPQTAYVVANDDPMQLGRVRVKYPWQSITKDEKGNFKPDDATPWIRISSPMASEGSGFLFTPSLQDEVLINFENENIERPYMVGALYNKQNAPQTVPSDYDLTYAGNHSIKSITSNCGHSITFQEAISGANFVKNVLPPALKTLTTFCPGMEPLNTFIDDTTKGAKMLSGGIQMTDQMGFYTVNLSAENREISIRCPLGKVNINAFTGIQIMAPNGNIKIEGKNVDIIARNKLNVTSGNNIEHAGPDERTKWQSFKALMGDTVKGLIRDKLKEYVCDLSLIRTILEVFLKPIDGTLRIKSKRYLCMEAGLGNAQIFNPDYYKSMNKEQYKRESKGKESPAARIRQLDALLYDLVTTMTRQHNDIVTKIAAYKKMVNDIPGHELALLFTNEDWKKDVSKIFQDARDKKEKLSDLPIDKQKIKDIKALSPRSIPNITSIRKELLDLCRRSTYKSTIELLQKRYGVDKKYPQLFENQLEYQNLLKLLDIMSKDLTIDDVLKKQPFENTKPNQFVMLQIRRICIGYAVQDMTKNWEWKFEWDHKTVEESWQAMIDSIQYHSEETVGDHPVLDYLADVTGFKGFSDQYVWDKEDYGQILFSNNAETLHYNGKSIEPYDLRRPSSLEEMKKALQNIKL